VGIDEVRVREPVKVVLRTVSAWLLLCGAVFFLLAAHALQLKSSAHEWLPLVQRMSYAIASSVVGAVAVFASVELWRLRRRGRMAALAYVAVLLCLLVGSYTRNGDLRHAQAAIVCVVERDPGVAGRCSADQHVGAEHISGPRIEALGGAFVGQSRVRQVVDQARAAG
jgi:hypothetical protein